MRISVNVLQMVGMLEKEIALHIHNNEFENMYHNWRIIRALP